MLPSTKSFCQGGAVQHNIHVLPSHISSRYDCVVRAPKTVKVQSLEPASSHHQQQQQQQQHWLQLPGGRPRVAAAAAGKGFGSASKTKTSGKSANKGRRKCPCGSGQAYESCCARYHSGSAVVPNPEALLRSRFSAYALQEVDYLVKTTHKQNPEYTGDDRSYARSLKKTAAGVEYIQLDIKGPVEQQELPQAYLKGLSSSSSSSNAESAAAAADAVDDVFLRFSVKWRPRAEGGGAQQVANEVSHFKKVDGTWLYYNEVDLA